MTNILLARGSSHARGKRPPAVEINSFSSYPKNTHLRTNIYFGAERILGYSTDISWTSSPRNMGKCPRKHMHLLRSLSILCQSNNSFWEDESQSLKKELLFKRS